MGGDIKKLPQALLEENAQLEQRNRLLNAELDHAYARISQMEQSASLRLGRLLLDCKEKKKGGC